MPAQGSQRHLACADGLGAAAQFGVALQDAAARQRDTRAKDALVSAGNVARSLIIKRVRQRAKVILETEIGSYALNRVLLAIPGGRIKTGLAHPGLHWHT